MTATVARARAIRLLWPAALLSVAGLGQLRPASHVEALEQPRWLLSRRRPLDGNGGKRSATHSFRPGGGTDGTCEESSAGLLTKDNPSTWLLFLAVLELFWKFILPKIIYHPLALVPIYLMLGKAISTASHRRVLRALLVLTGALPLVASLLYLAAGTYFFANFRKPPSDAAAELLLQRIRSGRAARTAGGSDVFYPPPRNDQRVGMVFFPGALVHHSAYAPVAGRLSDRGFTVIVQSLEPSRFVADVKASRRQALGSIADSGAEVDEWVLAGHSAGAMTAFNIASTERSPGAVFSKQVVLSGTGRIEFETGQTLRDAPVEVLVLNASRDGVVGSVGAEQRRAFREGLPPAEGNSQGGKTTYAMIDGGNHAGFADYGHQLMDGERTISLEEQHRRVVREIAGFLRKNKGKRHA